MPSGLWVDNERQVFRHDGRHHADADEQHRQDADRHEPVQESAAAAVKRLPGRGHGLAPAAVVRWDSPWPLRCAGRMTSRRRKIARPGTDRPRSRCRRQDGRIEIDVAARAVALRLRSAARPACRPRRCGGPSGQALLGSAVGSPGLATRHRPWSSAAARLGTRSAISCSRRSGPRFARSSGGSVRVAPPAAATIAPHVRRRTVGEDEAVEAVVSLLRVAARSRARSWPRRRTGRSPDARRRSVFIAFGSLLAEAISSVEGLRRRYREEREVDHGGAPFLPSGVEILQSHAAHPDRCIRRVRIGGAEVEAAEDRILGRGRKPGPRDSAAPSPFDSNMPVKQMPLAWLRRWPSAGPVGGASASMNLVGVRRPGESHPAV